MNTSEELNNLLVKRDLRPIAKSLGIKNFSLMSKNVLINFIIERQRSNISDKNRTNIMDEAIPEINIPILEPQDNLKYANDFLKKSIDKFEKRIKKEFYNFINWITLYIPKPFVKKVDEKI